MSSSAFNIWSQCDYLETQFMYLRILMLSHYTQRCNILVFTNLRMMLTCGLEAPYLIPARFFSEWSSSPWSINSNAVFVLPARGEWRVLFQIELYAVLPSLTVDNVVTAFCPHKIKITCLTCVLVVCRPLCYLLFCIYRIYPHIRIQIHVEYVAHILKITNSALLERLVEYHI